MPVPLVLPEIVVGVDLKVARQPDHAVILGQIELGQLHLRPKCFLAVHRLAERDVLTARLSILPPLLFGYRLKHWTAEALEPVPVHQLLVVDAKPMALEGVRTPLTLSGPVVEDIVVQADRVTERQLIRPVPAGLEHANAVQCVGYRLSHRPRSLDLPQRPVQHGLELVAERADILPGRGHRCADVLHG